MANPLSGILDSLTSLASGAAKPERVEGGPGDVGPTTATKKTSNLVSLPMTEAECGEWWRKYELGKARVKQRWTEWDTLLSEYLPVVSKSGAAETVKTQRHFRNVHTKIGQLFYRSPELILTAREPSPAQNEIPSPAPPAPGQMGPTMLKMEDLIFIKQNILNLTLGRKGIKVERLMDELLFDVLAWSGIGCSKLGYSCAFKTIPPAPQQPGSVLGLASPNPQQASGGEQVPIFEEKYWRRFSPKKIIFNHDLRSARYDEDATIMGMDFYMSPQSAMKKFGLTEQEANKAAADNMIFEYKDDKGEGGGSPVGLLHGVELWIKAYAFGLHDHPLAIFQLVLIEGIRDRPIVWRPSPDQEFNDLGQLTDDSLVGFPIRVLAIRDLADSPFPQADSAFTNSEIKQMSTWMRQSIALRDAQIGKNVYDPGAFDDDGIDALENGDVGRYIPTEAGKLQEGIEKILATTPKITASNDDYRGMAMMSNSVDETLGISANQAGVETGTIHSATEVKAFSAGSNSRNDKELGRVIEFYLDGVGMIDTLIMRYTDAVQWVRVEGESGAAVVQAWTGKTVSGKFYYDITPDSQLKADTAVERQLALNHYNIVAKDALSNRLYLLKRLARMEGLDPNKATIDPKTLQQPKPVPPSISFAFKGEDLADPTVQQILINAELLKPPTPPTGQAPPAAPGGPVAPVPPAHVPIPPHGGPVNKHEASNTGHTPNEPGVPNHRETTPQ